MREQRNNGEFHRADPGYRRRMQWLLGVIAVAGVLAVLGLRLWLSRMEATMVAGDMLAYERALGHVMAAVCIAFAVVAAAFATWLFRLAAATRAERRWPPSSMRTSADMQIRYLTSADLLVTQMKAGAIVLSLVALALLAWAAWLFKPA